eukprot:1141177_1
MNVDNFLSDKPSVRLHQRPGGQQNFNIFSGEDDASAQSKPQQASAAQPQAAPMAIQGAVVRQTLYVIQAGRESEAMGILKQFRFKSRKAGGVSISILQDASNPQNLSFNEEFASQDALMSRDNSEDARTFQANMKEVAGNMAVTHFAKIS